MREFIYAGTNVQTLSRNSSNTIEFRFHGWMINTTNLVYKITLQISRFETACLDAQPHCWTRTTTGADAGKHKLTHAHIYRSREHPHELNVNAFHSRILNEQNNVPVCIGILKCSSQKRTQILFQCRHDTLRSSTGMVRACCRYISACEHNISLYLYMSFGDRPRASLHFPPFLRMDTNTKKYALE